MQRRVQQTTSVRKQHIRNDTARVRILDGTRSEGLGVMKNNERSSAVLFVFCVAANRCLHLLEEETRHKGTFAERRCVFRLECV